MIVASKTMKPSLRPRLLVLSLLLISAAWRLPCAGAETLTVKVSGLKRNAGTVHVMIWRDAAGFPMEPEKAVARKVTPVTGARTDVLFTGLPAGIYAVAAFQDVNSNGKLDRSVMGWPKEPVGASNEATGLMGPPKFADAAFTLNQPNQVINLVVK